MGKSSKKQIKTSAAASASTSTAVATAAADTNYGDWASLPNGPLSFILSLLLSHTDVAAFFAVCHSWRSLASSPSSTHRPPLLLLPITYRFKTELRWSPPRRCRLLSPIPNSPTHHSPLPAFTLAHYLIGNSFSRLIFIRNRHVLLSNPFSGKPITPPNLDADGSNIYTHAFLTAPVSDPESRLLLTGSTPTVLVWQVRSRKWGQYQLARHFITPIQQIIRFKNRLLALDVGSRLFTVSFSPHPRVELWEDLMPLPEQYLRCYDRLAECGGELLRVVFCSTLDFFQKEMKVYKLDLSGKVGSWVRTETLGNWCLFIDVRGKSVTACSEPEKWGGRSNVVYMTGPGCDSWTEIALGSPLIDTNLPESHFHATNARLSPWPSPVWVYPSLPF